MGPKKKEQEIDLSTLPECKSINAIILCKGKKSRATKIIQRIQKEAEKYIAKIKKSEVLDHAKEKNIYVDPNTLNDKQKKDQKYMESINTELTSEVIAKAVQSLVNTLNIKIRIEKKNSLDKPAEDKQGRKYDVLYNFEDFPQSSGEFEELAKLNENIRYVLVVDPKITWANAPQIQEDQNQQEQEQQQDEQVKEYKLLLGKEEKIEEDFEFEKQNDERINKIRAFRSKSDPSSQFRNCVISVIQPEIDPYNEENSMNQLVKSFFENINKLNDELVDFEEWKKSKEAVKIGDPVKVEKHPANGLSILEMLDNISKTFDSQVDKNQTASNEDEILKFIDGFSIDALPDSQAESKSRNKRSKKQDFITPNQYIGQEAPLKQQIRYNLKYPGIDRFLMPQIPIKSERLRKLHQSQFAQFLKKGQDLKEYFRQQQLLNFEEYIKQFDEDRVYNFTDRIYEQHHDRQSLQRQLYKALELNEYNSFTKYDQNSDSLYLMMTYKNNSRRVSKKMWESNWKVIPNYQSWLKYFKNNENNLTNNNYYDIDYEKIGNIEETTRSFTLQSGANGAVVISRDCTVSNSKQSLLYALKNNFTFGVENNKFFGENNSIRVYHYLLNKQDNTYETLISLSDCKIRINSNGQVVVQKDGNTKMVTPEGYTILFEKDKSTILHPTGGITYNHDTYINEMGRGLKNGHLYTLPTLKRKTQNGEIIKRDDNTVIVNKVNKEELESKWIQFYDGTQYLINNNKIKIQKKGQPFFTCKDNNILVNTNQLNIRLLQKSPGNFNTLIEFQDGITLRVAKQDIYVFHEDERQEININITKNQISSKFGQEEMIVTANEAYYVRKNKRVNARQDEEKYGQDDLLPNDYIQPRLFIINNQNQGVQLISEKMVQGYLNQHQGLVDKIYENKVQNRSEMHIVTKKDKVSGKSIQNQLVINLDIFDNTNQQIDQEYFKYISLRTLLKYQPLTAQDVADLARVKNDVETWRKQNAKDENEFGYKSKDDPSTKDKIQSKLLVIKKRQEKQTQVNPEALKEAAKTLHLTTYEEIRKKLQKQKTTNQLRNSYLKKKNSIVRQYKKVPIPYQKIKNSSIQDKETEGFMDHYFMTAEGKKALSEMPQWVFRPKEVKPPAELDSQIRNELNNTNNLNKEDESEDQKERYDTVEVNLNSRGQKEIYIKPSVFTQRQIDEERYAFEHEKKAYKYHQAKRKDYNVYGVERKSKPEVPTLLRTQPISEINQKYLVTEAPLDKKVKISSMKNKLTSSASSMNEMRKQGPHSLLIKTLDKGNDINKLLDRRTMMVQADLNDKLQRDILINPIEANFGVILEKKTYQLKIDIKNEDVISQRITLKRPKNVQVKVQLNEMGPIAMGMTRKITVTIKATSEILGKFSDEFEIVTKHEIYHIPITAHVISEGQGRNQTMSLSRGVFEVEQPKKKQSSFQLPRLK